MRSWLERKLGHPLDLNLASLQIAVIAASVAAIVASIALYRHQSDDYVVDFERYIWSFKVAVPPLIAFLSTYVIAFLTGVSLTEAPKVAIRFLKNRLFQSRAAMALVTLLFAGFTAATWAYVVTQPPPAYEAFIGKLLGGESDGHRVARAALKQISSLNETRSGQFETALAVFEERRRWNMEDKLPSVEVAITFVRTLGANVADPSWLTHPLRSHALGEAYSMWADATRRVHAELGNAGGADNDSISYGNQAIELYEQVARSSDRFSTGLMRASAKLNAGNVHLYAKRYEKARAAYSELLADTRTWNLSAAGNLLACYIRMGKPDEALRLGNETLQRAYASGRAVREPSNYVAILEGIGFAHLAKGEIEKAVDFFRSSYGHINDKLAKQNLAIVMALAGDRQAGRKLIATSGFEPVTAENLNSRVGSGVGLGCASFIWGVIEDDRPQAAAPYFYGYLGEARPAVEFKTIGGAQFIELKRKVAQALEQDASPCGDLYRTPQLRARLGSK